MNSLSTFFIDNIVAVFFVSGLAYFLMGAVVAIESRRSTSLEFTRHLPFLACFGIFAGLAAWIEMFSAIPRSTTGPDTALLFHQIQPFNCLQCHRSLEYADLGAAASQATTYDLTALLAQLVSSSSLIYFGASHLGQTPVFRSWQRWVIFVLFLLWLAVVGLAAVLNGAELGELLATGRIYARYVFYLPGSLLTAVALFRQGNLFKHDNMPQIARSAKAAGVFFIANAVLAGFIVPPAGFWPASVLNYASFFRVTSVPVHVFVALLAVGIAYCVVHTLRAQEIDQQRRLEKARTARFEVQEQLYREVQRQVRMRGELLKQLITVQEDERRRIARELHDEMGQSLTGLAMGLEGLHHTLQQDPQLARMQLLELKGFTARAVDEIHRLVEDLRPALLDNLGLVPALRWFGAQLSERVGVDIQVEVSNPGYRLPAHVETVLFRLGQEALTNVARHSGATTATVFVGLGNEIRLVIEDNGRGFDLRKTFNDNGKRPPLGLVGMRERALLVGGSFEIVSRPGGGTRLTVRVPGVYEEERGEEDPSVACR